MTIEEFDEIALISNLEFTSEERDELMTKLDGMIELINYIENINTEGLDIMVGPLELDNIYRDDIVY